MSIEVVPLEEGHLEDAAALVTHRCRGLRQQVGFLPRRYAEASTILPLLRQVAGRETSHDFTGETSRDNGESWPAARPWIADPGRAGGREWKWQAKHGSGTSGVRRWGCSWWMCEDCSTTISGT
jgi:hypothetical protein